MTISCFVLVLGNFLINFESVQACLTYLPLLANCHMFGGVLVLGRYIKVSVHKIKDAFLFAEAQSVYFIMCASLHTLPDTGMNYWLYYS